MALSDNGSTSSAASQLSFLQRLAQRRQQLGAWALGVSCLFLSLRIWEQKKEVDRLKARELETITLLREENAKLKETLKNVREMLSSDEEAGEGSQFPALTRLEVASGESRPNYSETIALEGESSQIQNKAKKFFVL